MVTAIDKDGGLFKGTTDQALPYNSDKEFLKKRGFVATSSLYENFSQNMEVIGKWEPKKDTTYLRYSPFAASILGASIQPQLCSILLRANKATFLAKRFYVPIVVYGSVLSCVFSHVANRMTQGLYVFTGNPPCAVCREIRSVGIQMTCSFVYPILMSVGSHIYLMNQANIKLRPENKYQWAVKMAKRLRGPLAFNFGLQFLILGYIHYKSEDQWFNITTEMIRRMESAEGRKVAQGEEILTKIDVKPQIVYK